MKTVQTTIPPRRRPLARWRSLLGCLIACTLVGTLAEEHKDTSAEHAPATKEVAKEEAPAKPEVAAQSEAAKEAHPQEPDAAAKISTKPEEPAIGHAAKPKEAEAKGADGHGSVQKAEAASKGKPGESHEGKPAKKPAGDKSAGLNEPPALQTDLTNSYIIPPEKPHIARLRQFRTQLDLAKQARESKDIALAAETLNEILGADPPDEIKRGAMLEMATLAQQQNELTKAQQILSQYTTLFPEDPSIPDVLLRQGLNYRLMGANTLALSKFYALMTAALNLKLDRLDYYKRLVLHAQTEIAETYYLQGDYKQASDFFARLLKLNDPDLKKVPIQFKLIKCLSNQDRFAEVEAQAQDFLRRHTEAAEQPEVRFMLANALRRQGRNSDALQQVLLLLQSQQATAGANPENWLYWQQRTGNEIANQLYKEGDYVHALEVYFNLAKLDSSPAWQFPVLYQIGLVYERLQQPEKAATTYGAILGRQAEIQTNGTSGLKAMVEMAQWRQNFLSWQTKTTQIQHQLLNPGSLNISNASLEK